MLSLDDNCDDESTRINLYNTSLQIGVNCKDSFALIIGWLILVEQLLGIYLFCIAHKMIVFFGIHVLTGM